MTIRPITPDNFPLLERFGYEAIFIPPGEAPPPWEIVFEPGVFMYIDQFGSLPDDCGLIAELDGRAVGAAWVRCIKGYGYVDDATPELALSVLPEHRRQGIGTALMTQLFAELRQRGYARTSLAVQKANPAARLYLRLGYEIIAEKEEEFLMLKQLDGEKAYG